MHLFLGTGTAKFDRWRCGRLADRFKYLARGFLFLLSGHSGIIAKVRAAAANSIDMLTQK